MCTVQICARKKWLFVVIIIVLMIVSSPYGLILSRGWSFSPKFRHISRTVDVFAFSINLLTCTRILLSLPLILVFKSFSLLVLNIVSHASTSMHSLPNGITVYCPDDALSVRQYLDFITNRTEFFLQLNNITASIEQPLAFYNTFEN